MARLEHNYPTISKKDLQAPHIFVVDMINGFCKEGAMADSMIMDIAPAIQNILTIPNQVATPIFFVDAHEPDAIEFQSFPVHCVKGTKEVEIIDELVYTTPKYDIVLKNSTNGFHEIGSYLEALKNHDSKIKEIIITGCCTDICVMQFALTLKTWLNANDLPITVIIPIDCVDTYDSQDSYHPVSTYNQAALSMLLQAGIQVVGSIIE